ncbi:MAG: hypothetical protein JXR84_12750 [Anaerolineae bacterium]|nr:hypothetical protein [Anaerolineae bacterium]
MDEQGSVTQFLRTLSQQLPVLTDLLGVKVDLVMQDALKPYIGQRILREVIAV